MRGIRLQGRVQKSWGKGTIVCLFMIASLLVANGCGKWGEQESARMGDGGTTGGAAVTVVDEALAQVQPSYGSGRGESSSVQPPSGSALSVNAASEAVMPAEPLLDGGFTRAVNRRFVKNAKLHVEVDDLSAAIEEATQTASLVGGHVARLQAAYMHDRETSSPNADREPQRAWMTLRIPSTEFDSSLQRLRNLGQPLSDEIFTNDVTANFMDLEARIQNLAVQEEQLRRLLSETTEIGQIIHIYDRLTGVRSEIDRLKGSLQVLDEDVAFSTVELTLVQALPASGVDSLAADAPVLARAWHNLLKSFDMMLVGAKEGIVWLGGALPYLLVLALCGWMVGYAWKRWGKFTARKAFDGEDSLS